MHKHDAPVGSSKARRKHVTKTWNNTDVREAASQRPRITSGDVEATASLSLLRSGGHSRRKTPDPFPNSADKCANANGTASQDVGE
jgi:hypothetical protein